MRSSDTATRERIVEAADRLFYHGGYEHTSFADIAQAVGISRGNFYYHFKTKDEILDAVIERRMADTLWMLDCWQRAGETPAARILSFIHLLIANQADIMLYGCPVGTLSSEMAKLNHPARDDATGLFTLFRAWLRRQFAQMGRGDDADALALHLLARSQGVATLASALRDAPFVEQEVARMEDWLNAVAAGADPAPPAAAR